MIRQMKGNKMHVQIIGCLGDVELPLENLANTENWGSDIEHVAHKDTSCTLNDLNQSH